MNDAEHLIWDRVTKALVNHIEPIFKKNVLITVLVRTPGNPEADILVSSDTTAGIDEIVARSKTREKLHG